MKIKLYLLCLLFSISDCFIIANPPLLKKKNVIKTKRPQIYSIRMQKNTNNKFPIEFKQKKLFIYDIEVNSEIWAIISVYFVQGIIGLSSLAVTYYYKDVLHLSPTELSYISSISILPWTIKPFYGFISDTVPLFGYKRKSYLILSGLLSSLSWFSMSNLVKYENLIPYNHKILAVSLLTISSLGIALSDVLIDAIVVSKSQETDNSGSLQSICWTSASIGGLISSYASGALLEKYGIANIFSITSFFPLIIILVGLSIKENKISNKVVYDIKDNFKLILHSLRDKKIAMPILFLILWQATPSAGSSFFYFETNELGFTPEFFGKLSLISSISSIGGIYLYNKYFKNISLKNMFKMISYTGIIFSSMPIILLTHFNRQIGIPDEIFAIGDDIFLSVLGQIGFMPVLVLAADICPRGIEASLYATIMSINNLSGTFSSILGGIGTKLAGITENDFTNLPLLIIITNIIGLLPLLFLNLLPEEKK